MHSPATQELNNKLRFKETNQDDNEDSTSSFSEKDHGYGYHERREFDPRYYEDESDRGGSFRNSVSDRVKQDYTLLSNKSLYPVSINMVDDMSHFDYQQPYYISNPPKLNTTTL